MELYNTHTIDELARILVPYELRCKLGLSAESQLLLKAVDAMVVVQQLQNDPEPDDFVCKMDDLGRIKLPSELRRKLGWKEKDMIDMYTKDSLIILKK